MNLELICKDLLGLDSSSSFGTKAASHFLIDLARGWGLACEEHACTPTDSNVRFSSSKVDASSAKITLILQAHLDSDESLSAFQEYKTHGLHPFQPSLSKNKIYGVGASSGKVDAFCQAYGLSLALKEKPDAACFSLGTFGRYQGMHGILRATRRGWLHGRSAIVAEATNLQFVVATKGFARLRIQLPIPAAEMKYRVEHDSQESTSSQVQIFSGENSLKKAFEYLSHLPNRGLALIDFDCEFENPHQSILDLETGFHDRSVIQDLRHIYEALVDLERDFLSVRDESFSPPTPTWQLQSVKTTHDSVEIIGTCAMLPQVKAEVYEEWMHRIRLACQNMGGLLTLLDAKRAFQATADSPLLKAAVDSAVLKPAAESSGHAPSAPEPATKISMPNEASMISRLGIDCICFGPGERLANSFERVDLNAIEKAILFYKEIVLKLG